MVKEIQKQHMFMVQDSLPWSLLLMKILPFSLLEVDDSFSITHPFPGVRFCVINHVSDPKMLSLISVICPTDTRQAHTMRFVIMFWILCHPVNTHFSVIQLVPDNSVLYPVNV